MKNKPWKKIPKVVIPKGYEIEDFMDFGGEEYEEITPSRAEEVRIEYAGRDEREKAK